MPPLIVLRDPDEVRVVARRLRESGHRVHDGFALTDEPFALGAGRLMCTGRVDGPSAAVAALVAAVRGAGLLVGLALEGEIEADFLDDLRRIGKVTIGTPPNEARGPAAALAGEARLLLELLADGATIPEAARQLYISVRTAERRVGHARKALGVRTTAEAIAALHLPDPKDLAGPGEARAAVDPYRR